MSSYDPFSEAFRRKPPDIGPYVRRYFKHIIALFVALFVLGTVWSAYYQVEPDELGVVLRFGEAQEEFAQPGPHLKIPYGIDRAIKVPVGRQLQQEFGFRTVQSGVRSQFAREGQAPGEATMLTGDRNVAIVEWIVQYKIHNPKKYLFHFRNVENTLRLMTEATMRSVIGDHSIDEVLTTGRASIEQSARQKLIDLSKLYDTGLSIELVNLKNVNVPQPVQPALREVEEAKQERERKINEAWSEYNQVIPRAQGRAEQAKEAARGYAVERVNRAKGDANRFRALVIEYRKAPSVTRTRMYIEAMSEILPKAKRKVLIDAKTQGLVPLLNMAEGGGK